ncbi:hypothetical protein LCGC14_2471430 [marine sediment metagenome]|uniref:Uncharacterized protein n=1 Tax=marine sediment metagenome TaxID=412755 RepID=A0A0F9DMC7_9ZZZZ
MAELKLNLGEWALGGFVITAAAAGTYLLREMITPKKYNPLMEDMRIFWAVGLGGYVALEGTNHWLVNSLMIGSALGAVIEPPLPPLAAYLATEKSKQQKRRKK